MSNQKQKSKRFVGVYYRESDDPRKSHNGRRDKCFSFFYRVGGKSVWEKTGWSSEGMTEQETAKKRTERLAALGASPEALEGLREKREKKKITFEQAAEAYWLWAESEGRHTKPEKSRYGKHLGRALGHIPLSSITPEMLLSMKSKLLKIVSPQSAKHVLSLVRRVINHAIRTKRFEGTAPFGTHSVCTMPAVDNEGERFLTPKEGRLLIAELRRRSRQTADMALLALSCGLRACEVFALKGGDLDSSAGVLYVTAKGGKRETVYAPKTIIDMIAAYGRGPDEYVFQTAKGGKLNQIPDTFRRAVVALGLDNGNGRKGRVWFHTCRHSFASELAKQPAATIPELKAATRHKRIEMLDRYLHARDKQLKGKINRVSEKFAS